MKFISKMETILFTQTSKYGFSLETPKFFNDATLFEP